MTIQQGEPGTIGISFKQEFLPRPVLLTHQPDRRRLHDDPDAGRLWVVARQREATEQPPDPEPVDPEDYEQPESDLIDAPIMPAPPPKPPVIAYVVARYDETQDVVWVDDIAVAREFRRRKVAERLLDGARQWAREQGAHRLLVAVPTKHVPMMQLLGGLGLTFCGYNDQYFVNHDIAVMFGLRLTRRGRVE
jgi:GNAT superfamily N-acetyltransferase